MSDPISIVVRQNEAARVPSVSRVRVTAGQQINFQAADVASTLYFSPDLMGILTPAPEASVTLTPGADLSYSITGEDPGAYEILFQAPELEAPTVFDPPAADQTSFLLLLKSAAEVGHPLSSIGTPAPTPVTPPVPVGGVTSNPIQTIQARGKVLGVTSNPIQTFMASAESEELDITSNPIQT